MGPLWILFIAVFIVYKSYLLCHFCFSFLKFHREIFYRFVLICEHFSGVFTFVMVNRYFYRAYSYVADVSSFYLKMCILWRLFGGGLARSGPAPVELVYKYTAPPPRGGLRTESSTRIFGNEWVMKSWREKSSEIANINIKMHNILWKVHAKNLTRLLDY